MQKEDFIEILTNELAYEYESEIEKVLVFYKNGEKLMISTGDKEIQVEKMDLPEDDCGCYEEPEADHSTVINNIINQVEVAKENILSHGTQMIQLPSGRRINVIN